MRTAQQGDRVHVHFVKRAQNGDVISSQGKAPLELTVGTDHCRLPGLGLALVGRGEGERIQVQVPAERAYGLPRAERVFRLDRGRFSGSQVLSPGRWVRVANRRGHRRLVRIVEVSDRVVVVDTNHPWAGQAVSLEVEIVSIHAGGGASGEREPFSESSYGG